MNEWVIFAFLLLVVLVVVGAVGLIVRLVRASRRQPPARSGTSERDSRVAAPRPSGGESIAGVVIGSRVREA